MIPPLFFVAFKLSRISSPLGDIISVLAQPTDCDTFHITLAHQAHPSQPDRRCQDWTYNPLQQRFPSHYADIGWTEDDRTDVDVLARLTFGPQTGPAN